MLVLVAVLAGTATGAGGAGAAGPQPCAGSATHVPMVIDFGTVPGSPGGIVRECVTVSPSATGSDALAAAAAQLGWTGERQPRYGSDGILCGIGGFPAAPTCPVSGAGRSQYWSYWSATPNGSWAFSSTGPGSSHPCATASGSCDLQGWRFVDTTSAAASAAQPPRWPTDPATIYLPSSATPPTSPGSASPVPPGPVPPPGDPADLGGAPTTARSPASGGGDRPATSGSASTTTAVGRASQPSRPSTTTHRGSAVAPSGNAAAAAAADQAAADRRIADRVGVGAGSHPAPSAKGSSGAVGLLVGVAAVLAVVTAGLVQSRRRRHV